MFVERAHSLYEVIKECVYTTEEGLIDRHLALDLMHTYLKEVQQNKGIVYVIGNGGSTGIASHFCTDLLKALSVPAMTLFDSNLLTCIGNDLGYENVFSKQIKTLMHKEDMLVAISSSGKSPNILNATDSAREVGALIVTLSGFSPNNPLRTKGDLNFWLNAQDYGLVEIGHSSLLHTVIDTWHSSKHLNTVMAHANKD